LAHFQRLARNSLTCAPPSAAYFDFDWVRIAKYATRVFIRVYSCSFRGWLGFVP
jgi:hypothetical protein